MKAEDCKFYDQFFEGNKRQYIIPVYQRNYDWTIEECKNLFDDIINAYKHDKEHFIGSIIQVQKDEENGIKPFIVIDGQQRLTTVYLLLTALLEFEENIDRKDVIIQSLFNNFKGEEPKKQFDKYKLKLKANTFDNNQLVLLMTKKFEQLNTSSNIYKNYEYFSNLIDEKLKSGYTSLDIRKAIEKLIAVVISLNQSKGDDPQVIFERINSTGLPLMLDDLVRNYVLMTELDQEYLFDEYWSKLERFIPKQHRTQYLINYLNAFTSSPVTEKNAYDVFKRWASGFSSKEDVLRILVRYAKYYSAFISKSDHYSKDVNDCLLDLRKLDQSTAYTFLFNIFDDFEKVEINESTLIDTLLFLITYSVRRMVCEVPSNSLRGLYKNLYKRIFEKVDKPFDYLDVVISFMLNELKGTRDEVPNDIQFAQYLKLTKLYRNRKLCRYLLGTLENNHSKEKIDVDASEITIEHILPQDFNNLEWRSVLNEDYERVYSIYLDTIGNLTLTGYNSSLSNNSFEKKKKMLETTITKVAYLNKEFKESPIWDEEIINKRADRLTKDLINIFVYPTYSGKTYHKKSQSAFLIIDFDSVELATKANPVFFEYRGENFEVKSFRDVGIGVLSKIYEENQSEMTSLAIEKFRPWVPNSDRIYLSDNPKDLNEPRKINGSNIYFESNVSSVYILYFLKRLFDVYQIDYSEFKLYCKK